MGLGDDALTRINEDEDTAPLLSSPLHFQQQQQQSQAHQNLSDQVVNQLSNATNTINNNETTDTHTTTSTNTNTNTGTGTGTGFFKFPMSADYSVGSVGSALSALLTPSKWSSSLAPATAGATATATATATGTASEATFSAKSTAGSGLGSGGGSGTGTGSGQGLLSGGSMFGSGFGFTLGSFSPPPSGNTATGTSTSTGASTGTGTGTGTGAGASTGLNQGALPSHETPLPPSGSQPLSLSEPLSALPPSAYRQNGNGIPYRGNTNLTLVTHATQHSESSGGSGGSGGGGSSSGLFTWARLDDEILQPMFGDGNSNNNNTITTISTHTTSTITTITIMPMSMPIQISIPIIIYPLNHDCCIDVQSTTSIRRYFGSRPGEKQVRVDAQRGGDHRNDCDCGEWTCYGCPCQGGQHVT